MTDELDLYAPPADLATIQQRATDDWFDAFANIVKLAEYVADTEFVPDTMRRRPAAVAAAILTGREMGLAPMVALRMLHIIKGRVGQSAELMRALVLRAGHEIRDVEITDNRVVLEGRRRNETDWARAAFTSEDARKARIDLGGYPKDKLYARATTRLCRRKFADIIAGLPSVDEIEDGYTGEVVPLTPVTTPAVQRTRKPKPAKAAATQPKPASTTTTPQPDTPDDITELLGDEAPATPPTPAEAEQPEFPTSPGRRPDDEPVWPTDLLDMPPEDDPEAPRLTAPQLVKLSIGLERAGFHDSESARAFVAEIIGRTIPSRKDLTVDEASRVIDILENQPPEK